MEPTGTPRYLLPYLRAAERHGAGFGALLWASPTTQARRFEALTRLIDLNGLSLLDVGCGRADLLDYLLGHGIQPADYIGIEAVGALADAAQAKRHSVCTIVRGDFVVEPARLLCGADVVVFSGSLNTLEPADFYRTLRVAYDAAGQAVLFNFLCAASLAASEYLNWYRRADVLSFARSLAADVRLLDDYLSGDCTVAIRRSGADRPARRTEAQRQEEGT